MTDEPDKAWGFVIVVGAVLAIVLFLQYLYF
jgi:hypothetical protein